MTFTRSGRQYRAGSSRAPSVAHEIIKRRDKPYKTEKQRVLTRKKKFQSHTSYKDAPEGFTFVAVGTPELSDRCKELSKQKSLPVSVVNAQRNPKQSPHPDRLSFHVHRVGYHFKSEVVEQACEELGYEPHRDVFVKTADLQAQLQKSSVARIMARHGIRMNKSPVEGVQDTPAKVRAAIKELFPHIPDPDLDQIVTHSWEEGTGRVGSAHDLDLSRRVQLATVARIRHVYTDYDRLLRAFEWHQARAMVEQDTLRKLIEWRGENEDDNELEEIVRETIVIDDDDDEQAARVHARETDDEDSDFNDISDASIEVTHHVAQDYDLGAESVDETGRRFLQRFQPRYLRTEQQHNLAREKIGAARQNLRLAPPSQATDVVPVNVQVNELGLPPDSIVVDGMVYHRAPPPVYEQPQLTPVAPPSQQYSGYGTRYPTQVMPTISQPYGTPVQRAVESGRRNDTILPSIEPHVPVPEHELPYTSNYRAVRLPILNGEHIDKRPRFEYSKNQPHLVAPHSAAGNYPSSPSYHAGTVQSTYVPRRNEPVINLTSPNRNHRSSNPGPMKDVRATPQQLESGSQHYLPQGASYGPPPSGAASQLAAILGQANRQPPAPDPEPYDPRQPLVQFSDRRTYQEPYAPPAAGSQPTPSRAAYTATAPPAPTAPYGAAKPYISQPSLYSPAPQRQTIQREVPQTRYIQLPQPVHGAPAPVQQSPYDVRTVQAAGLQPQPHPLQQQMSSPAQPPPVNGAPHPAQYYYPR